METERDGRRELRAGNGGGSINELQFLSLLKAARKGDLSSKTFIHQDIQHTHSHFIMYFEDNETDDDDHLGEERSEHHLYIIIIMIYEGGKTPQPEKAFFETPRAERDYIDDHDMI